MHFVYATTQTATKRYEISWLRDVKQSHLDSFYGAPFSYGSAILVQCSNNAIRFTRIMLYLECK